MIHIEPLGTGVILPAFMVGYELPLPLGCPDQLKGFPDWLLILDQQAGGLSMSYPSVVGAVLRLDANRDKGKKDLSRLLRGIRCMAEDPDMETLRQDYPVLGRLVKTHGNEYEPRELRDLENILSANLWMPPLKTGVEAFLRHAPCDPIDYFRGWKVLRCSFRSDAVLPGSDAILRGSAYNFPDADAYYIDSSNLADLELDDDVVYDGDGQDELMKVGEKLGRPGEPDLFFLWENSD